MTIKADDFYSLVEFCTDNPNKSDVRDAIHAFCYSLMGEYIYTREDMIKFADTFNVSRMSKGEIEQIFDRNKENYGKFK